MYQGLSEGPMQGRIQTVAQVAHATVNTQLHNNIFGHLTSFSKLHYIESALRWIFLFDVSR